MRKLIATLLVSAMIVSMLVGCSSSKTSTSDNSDETVTIQFMHQQVEQERQEVVDKIIADFEDKNPGIIVESIPVGEDDFDTKVTSLAQSGELPAIMEFSQDQAKTYVTNELINTDANNAVIAGKGEDAFFDGALSVIKTEDGTDYVGVPISGWVQGIWCNTAMLEEAGYDVPETWDDVLKIAKAFYDPDNQKYGIAIPTADDTFTEQVFSQFALSNGANVLDSDGNVIINSDAMAEAAEFYKELASYSMTGSIDVTGVKDTFVAQNTPMAVYSTYILSAVNEAGFLDDVQLAIPTNTESAAYGCVVVLSISSQISDAETEAAEKFIDYMLSTEGNEAWITMSPGGVQPVIKEVAEDTNYTENEAIVPFSHLLENVGEAFDNLKLFGSIDGKNYMVMGDITNSGIISKAIYNIVVQDSDIKTELQQAQTDTEALMAE